MDDSNSEHDEPASASSHLRDAFSTDHLWRPSTLYSDPSTYESSLFTSLQLDFPAIKLDNSYAPKDDLEREVQLPDLETFGLVAAASLPEEVESLSLEEEESSGGGSLGLPSDLAGEERVDDDLWQVALELGPADKDVEFFTWEAFEGLALAEGRQRRTAYITERGAETFDAALAVDSEKMEAGRVVRGDVFLESLWNLGLGRSSILFNYNPKRNTFEPGLRHVRASGASLRAAQSVTNQFVHIGNTFVYLRSFVERTFASNDSIYARVALATSVASVLSSFEDHLGKHAKEVKSLLQLQHLFSKPRDILVHTARVVDAAKHARTNEQLSSILYQRVLEIEEGDQHIRVLSSEIMRQVAKPTLELLGEWIGIQQGQETTPIPERDSFVAIEEGQDGTESAEYVYRPECMPKFMTDEDARNVFETGNSLHFLKVHHPDHPLASLSKFGVHPPELEWRFGWQDIEAISSKAKDYEERLRTAILDFQRGSTNAERNQDCSSEEKPSKPAISDLPDEDFERYFEESARTFDAQPKPLLGELPDELQVITEQILDTVNNDLSLANTFSPPISITSALSFRPLLSAQAKLVNATSLRLFFRSHQLRLHLDLQRQYHLFGDGVFSSRLSYALFDPDRESAEMHKGQMRSGVHMGLQLGARSSWPPASSELRLALMGVLSESYYTSALYHSTQTGATTAHSSQQKHPPHKQEPDELPGQLNFAIRQLTESEMQKIMDPHSLHALDFLRLQYIPPSPLNLVITPTALDKYDQLFKFLLRLLRMLFVVSRLPRTYPDAPSRHLRTEAHHFVTQLASYVFQTGIAEPWAAFQALVATLEARLAREDERGELGSLVKEGIAQLRDAHERCLDGMLFALLLRRRQRRVLGLVEEVFGCVLGFARVVGGRQQRGGGGGGGGGNADADGGAEKESEAISELYAKMRGKIRVFLSVCRGLSGKKGYGRGRGGGEENTLERLAVLMEGNGYFG